MMQELNRAAQRAFNCEKWDEGESYDVVIVGIPSDVGALSRHRSAASGIKLIRQASQIYKYSLTEEGHPVGWYDYDSGKAILKGIKIADAGDFNIDRYQPESSLAKLPDVLQKIKSSTNLLVVLGGDHSISYWTTQCVKEPHRFVHIDAHEDATAALSRLPHSGNFIRYIESFPQVKQIIQYGLRGLVPNLRKDPLAHRTICTNHDQYLKKLNETRQLPAFVSIDVDVVSPSILRAVSSPSPGGMTSRQLINAIYDIKKCDGEIDVLELTEFAIEAGEDPLSGMFVADLLLRLISVCVA